MATIVTFQDAKQQHKEKQEEERILFEIKQRHRDKVYYGIGEEPKTDMTTDEYVSWLCQDIPSSSKSYFRSRWFCFLSTHPEIKIVDLINVQRRT